MSSANIKTMFGRKVAVDSESTSKMNNDAMKRKRDAMIRAKDNVKKL